MKTALAFLDLTEMDKSIVAYSRHLMEQMGLEKITFLHYIEFQDVTDDYSEYFPEMDRPLKDIVAEEVEDVLKEFNFPEGKYDIKIYDRGGQDGLLKFINDSTYDLCIFGKKRKAKGTGVFAGKVARLIDKSVLFATQNENPVWRHYMVPVDFSRYSRDVMKVADDFACTTKSHLTVLHVYKTPPTYFPFMEESNAELLKEVKEESSSQLDKFCKKNCECENLQASLLHARGEPVANQIYDYAQRKNVDLLLIGVKGKNDDDGLLIGSVAERLIQSDRDIPVLLVKPSKD